MVTLPTNNLRILVDANVLVAGTLWPRWPYEVIQHALKGHFRLVLTARIIQEGLESVAKLHPASFDILLSTLQEIDYEEIPVPSKAQLGANANLVRDSKDIHVALADMNGQVN